MSGDGYGDYTRDEESEILDSYTKWLHHTANRLLPQSREYLHDDVVQEGRVAMWRALYTHDASKGSLPSWLTGAAVLRMRDVALGHGKEFGHAPLRGSREVESVAVEDITTLLHGSVSLEGVELAYHHGEIMEALSRLSPSQREYVFLRFWGNVDPSSRTPHMKAVLDQFPVLRKRFLWTGTSRQTGARDRLAKDLAHLVETRT